MQEATFSKIHNSNAINVSNFHLFSSFEVGIVSAFQLKQLQVPTTNSCFVRDYVSFQLTQKPLMGQFFKMNKVVFDWFLQ